MTHVHKKERVGMFSGPTSEKLEKNFIGFQWVLAILHIGLALGLAIYAETNDKDWKTVVYTEYNAWVGRNNESCASGDGCYIYSVKEEVGKEPISLIWATASFSFISGAHHLYAAVYSSSYLKNYVFTGVNIPRWLDYAGSSGIMFTVISILFTSPPTLTVIALSYALQFLVIVAGGGADIAWALASPGDNRYSKLLFYTTLIVYCVPWGFLLGQFQLAATASPTKDSCGKTFPLGTKKMDPPEFVTAAILGLFLTFSLFAVVQGIKIHRATKTKLSMLKFEYWFSFLSFVSKISLLGNVAAGVIGRSDNNIDAAPTVTSGVVFQNGSMVQNASTAFPVGQDDSDGSDTTTFWIFLGTSLGLSAVLGIVMLGSAYSIGFSQRGMGKSAAAIRQDVSKNTTSINEIYSTSIYKQSKLIF